MSAKLPCVVKTTADFAQNNIFLNWFVGGLNFQIEHHLFPHICHVHYKKLSKIVKETAQEFNLPYNEYKTMSKAVICDIDGVLLHDNQLIDGGKILENRLANFL